MSSKIYGGPEAAPAEPVHWQQVGACGLAGEDAESRAAALERETERRVSDARHSGYQEGFAAAKKEAAGELQALGERVARTIAELAGFKPVLRRQAEADLLQLALAIARRILHRELAVDPDAMQGLIQSALDKLGNQQVVRVRIHPSQEQAVRKALGSRAVALVTDSNLEPGAALFEGDRGNLDASIESQLREIELGLADRLRRK